MFASVAIVAMLSTAVPTTVLGAASYSDELQGAYDYAYAIGITTQSTIDTANMYGTLIRAHMAKMMVNYATEVLGLTPNTSLTCEFTDVANQTEELQGYIKEACQLGLMGQGINAFDPNGTVTRAQFGTVLSRALYGDTYNVDTNPYYAEHLAALKDAGIMTMIDNPSQVEVRGYVMLMMQRAAGGNATPTICQTPENVLSCSLGLDTCPAQCQTVENKEGTLSLSSIGVDYTNIPMAGLVKFGSVKFDAASSDITINSVKIKKSGLSSLSGATRIFFEKDGVRVTWKASFSDNVATVSFTTPLVVKAGSSETLDVILNLFETAGSAEIKLTSTDVSSSAQTVNGSFSSASLITFNYPILNVTGAAIVNNLTNAKVDDTKLVELGELTVEKTDSTKAAIVTALTLNNSGSSDLAYLKDVAVYRDDVKVSTKTTVGSRSISFVLADEIKTTQTSPIHYVVKGKIASADRVGDTYNFYLRNKEDLTVLEKDTLFRTSINATVPAVMGLITIAWGDLRFNENTVSAMNVIPGSLNVIFYSGTISTLEPITLDTLYVTGTSTAGNLSTVLQNLYVKIGTTVIAVDDIPAAAAALFKFDGQATVNGTVPFMIYGDIKSDAAAGDIAFTTTSVSKGSFSTAEYVNDGSSVGGSIGSIGGRKATIAALDFALSNSSATSKNVQRGDRNIEVAKLEFSTTSDIVSKLYSFKVAVDAASTLWQTYDGAQVTLYAADGTALASDVIRIGATRTGTFTLPSALTVAKWAPVDLTVKLDQVPNAVSTTGIALKLLFNGVIAKDMINQNYVGTGVSAGSTILNSVIGGTPSIVNQSYTNSLVKYGTVVSLWSLKLKAVNADVVVKNLYFTLATLDATGMNKISSPTLYEDGVSIGTLTKTATWVYITNVNKTLTVGTSKTYEIKATLSTINSSGDALPTFTTVLDASTFESAYGAALSTVLTGSISANITAINEIPTVTAVTANTKGNDVVYKISFASTKETTLKGITLSVFGTNLSGGNTVLNGLTGILASDDLGTTVYQTALVATNGLILSWLADTAVSIQGTRDLYVILKGAALLDGNGNTPVTVRLTLTDLAYNDVYSDDSYSPNYGVLAGYQSIIAGTLDLTKIVTIQ